MWVKLSVCWFSRHPYVRMCVCVMSVSYYCLTACLRVTVSLYLRVWFDRRFTSGSSSFCHDLFSSLFSLPAPWVTPLSLRHGLMVCVRRMSYDRMSHGRTSRLWVVTRVTPFSLSLWFRYAPVTEARVTLGDVNIVQCVFLVSFTLWSRVRSISWDRRGQPFNCSVSV